MNIVAVMATHAGCRVQGKARQGPGGSAAGSPAPRIPGPAPSASPGSHPRPTESTSAGQRDPQAPGKLEGYTEVSEGLAV